MSAEGVTDAGGACPPNASPLPAGVAVVTHNMADGTTVAVLTPRAPQRDALAFLGFGGWCSGMELHRLMLLAQTWRARIAVPELPGCSAQPSRILTGHAVAVARGDFRPLARQMALNALACLGRDARPEAVVGYSLGASLAAAALAAIDPDRLPSGITVLVEPVAIRRWNPLTLLYRSRHEDVLAEPTLEWSRGLFPAATPEIDDQRPQHHLPSLVATGMGLSAGRLLPDLLDGLHRRIDSTVIVVHGTSSGLSTPGSVHRVIQQVRQVPARVVDVTVDGGHAFWHSLDRVRDVADQVRAAWP